MKNVAHTGSYIQMYGTLKGTANFAEQRQKAPELLKTRMYFRSKTSNLDQLEGNSNSIAVYNGFDLDEDKVHEVLPNLPLPSRKSLEIQPKQTALSRFNNATIIFEPQNQFQDDQFKL